MPVTITKMAACVHCSAEAACAGVWARNMANSAHVNHATPAASSENPRFAREVRALNQMTPCTPTASGMPPQWSNR